MKHKRNWLLFVIVVFIWSSNWSIMKSGFRFIDPLNFIFHRFSLSALALTPALFFLRKQIPRNSRDLILLIFLGIINSLGIFSTNTALIHEESGISAIITYTQPLFVFCMAIPFLEEKADINRLLGLSIGFLGVIILLLKTLTINNSIYPVYLLFGAFFWAVSIIFYKKFMMHIEPMITSFFQLSVGALLFGLIDFVTSIFLWPKSMQYLFIIFYSSIGASSIAFTIWLFLLKEEDATVLSSSSLIIPLISFFFGWFLLREIFEFRSLLGAILITIGVYLVNRNRKN